MPRAATSREAPDLLEQAQSGNAAAFEELFSAHEDRLHDLIRGLLGDVDEVYDVLQEVALTVFRKLGQFKRKAELGTWLHRIAVNAALMRIRQNTRRPEP